MRNVRRYYHLVDIGDIAGLVGLFAERATYCRPGYAPIVGRAALERFYRQERVIECGVHEILELIEQDGRVAVNGKFGGVLKDGSSVSVRFADFFILDEHGLFTRRETFFFTPAV